MVQGECHTLLSFFGSEECFFLGVGQEAQLNEYAGHCGFVEDEESGLTDAAAFPAYLLEGFFYAPCNFYAFFQEGVLVEGEHDVGFGGAWVKIAVVFLVVGFFEDDFVFAHGYAEVGFCAVQSHGVGFSAVGTGVGCGVTVDGYEEVGFLFVSELGSAIEFYELVFGSCIDDLDVGCVLLNEFSGFFGDGECNVFFQGAACSDASWVASAVSGVQDEDVLVME